MPSVHLTRNVVTLLEEWRGWFAPPGRKAPPAKPFVNALISHCDADHEDLSKGGFSWNVEEVGDFSREEMTLSRVVHEKLVVLADALMPGTPPQKFLDRLLEYYAQEANKRLLREILRNHVVDSYYRDEMEWIAIDVPLDDLPGALGEMIPQPVLLEAVSQMARELLEKKAAEVKEIMARTKMEVLGSNGACAERYQFVAFEVQPSLKKLLTSSITRPMKFSSHLAAYLVKNLKVIGQA